MLPDANSLNANKQNLYSAYNNLAQKIPSIKFADWGQWQDKDGLDCDELDFELGLDLKLKDPILFLDKFASLIEIKRALEKGSESFQEFITRHHQAGAKTFKEMAAPPPVEAKSIQTLHWYPGNPLPRVNDDLDGLEIVFHTNSQDGYEGLLRGLINNGWKNIYDASPTGSGKSYRAGNLNLLDKF
ncbi:MAG: hypothetical protein HC796_09340 [Synechococcaceae cyanobacterium RL_1_2]|nr:hypothetical protein [Synechococcaceae cyanobacterium RL_1_2]